MTVVQQNPRRRIPCKNYNTSVGFVAASAGYDINVPLVELWLVIHEMSTP